MFYYKILSIEVILKMVTGTVLSTPKKTNLNNNYTISPRKQLKKENKRKQTALGTQDF